MTRPRSAEDLDELHLRARLRLARRSRPVKVTSLDHPAAIRYSTLRREASALVAAIDALREDEPRPLDVPPQCDGRDGSIEISAAEEDAMIAGEDDNMRRWEHGDR